MAGDSPCASSRSTDRAAVNPAVPMIMAWRAVRSTGRALGQAGRETGVGGETAVARHAQVVAVGQDLGAHGQARIGAGHHLPGQVHSGDEGGDPGHPVAGDGGQGVFVVDRRPPDPDDDLPGGELVGGQRGPAPG